MITTLHSVKIMLPSACKSNSLRRLSHTQPHRPWFGFLLFCVRRSNFLYDVETDTLNLIDFGAVQAYPHDFCYNYARFPPKPRH